MFNTVVRKVKRPILLNKNFWRNSKFTLNINFRSKSCPQCRNKCTDKNIQRIYFNIVSSDNIDNPAALLQKIDDLELKVRSKDKEYKENVDTLDKIKKDLKNSA